MKGRRPSIEHFLDDQIRSLQQDRLVAILRGEVKPNCARERLFAKRARKASHIRLGDFILPPAMFLVERHLYGPGTLFDADDPV